jgi:superfamily II DNA or RNA helicase
VSMRVQVAEFEEQRKGRATPRNGRRVTAQVDLEKSATRAPIVLQPQASSSPLLLHGTLRTGTFILWGEAVSIQSANVSAGGRHKRTSGDLAVAADDTLISPFDPGAEALVAAIRSSGIATANNRTKPAVLLLPSHNGRPVASSPLIAEPPATGDRCSLGLWRVTTVELPWRHAIEFLSVCAGKRVLADGVIVADDLMFWVAGLRLAAALVARQHFLPDVIEDNGRYIARWRPVPSNEETRAMAQLAAAMPDVCRALQDRVSLPRSSRRRATDTVPAHSGRETSSPLVVLSEFIAGAVDQLVRSAAMPAAASLESVDEQWLAALSQPDGNLEADHTALDQLRQRLQDWWRPVALHASSPFRLCFRLEEPAPPISPCPSLAAARDDGRKARRKDCIVSPDGAWRLAYLLQARQDPSLMLPTSEAWSAPQRTARLVRQSGFDIHEYLLHAFGEAAHLYPLVGESLRGEMPAGVELDAAGAVAFVTEQAGKLEQAGFGVMLPAGWTSRGSRLHLVARAHAKPPAMTASGGLSLEALAEIDFRIALGDHEVTLDELRALAELKVPLVRARGQWVLLDAQEIERAIALLQREPRQATVQETLRMALGATSPNGIELDRLNADGWLGDLVKQLNGQGRVEELGVPGGFRGTLRPYQERGYWWLAFLRRWGLGACLADDMGLGKTVQTLAHILYDRAMAPVPPVLLVCPTSVIGNWQHESTRFAPGLEVLVHHGSSRAREQAEFLQAAGRYDVVLTSYSLLQRDFATLNQITWSGVVLDEAQNIKNAEAKQARAARELKAGYRIALTGTPVENNVGDLWSLMEFLNPGLLGNAAEFKRKFFVPIQVTRDSGAAERLKRLTAPFILRRLKTDKTVIADLPDKLEMKVYCTLTPEQASLYAAVVEEAMPTIESSDGIQRKGMVLAMLSKLKQICNHPAQFLKDNSAIIGRSGKLARLVEMLEEASEAGERALVFSQFAEMGAIIKGHLESTFGREVLFLHGGVPKQRRDEMVVRFQNPASDGPVVFVLSLKAGGTGLNLTAASRVFHFDRWWNPAVEQQATDRAFRIGQRRQVFVHKFVCAGTLEEKIDGIIEGKRSMAQAIVGSGEEWLTKLSTAELRELLTLRGVSQQS